MFVRALDRRWSRLLGAGLLALGAVLCAVSAAPAQTSTRTPTRTATATAEPTDTRTVTGTPTDTVTRTPTATRTKTPAPTCGDDHMDDGETCDDGNTFGGDGCSANCTLESARTFLISPPASEFRLQTLNAAVSADSALLEATLTLVTGAPALDGRIAVAIPAGGIAFAPVQTSSACTCIRALPIPTRFGTGNAGAGWIDCGDAVDPVDFLLEQDHDTGDVDPDCLDEAPDTLDTACRENEAAPPLCNPRSPHDGVCNGPLRVLPGSVGAPGSGAFEVALSISVLTSPTAAGGCAPHPGVAAYGPDGLACTSDDPGQRLARIVPISTGQISAQITDANHMAGATLGPGQTCGLGTCQVTNTGAPFDCSALAVPDGSLDGAALALTVPLIDGVATGDLVVGYWLNTLGGPTVTPQPTRTPSPTRTPTEVVSPSPTRTATITRTPTKTRTPTLTRTPQSTATSTRTLTPTWTVRASQTRTETRTPSPLVTPTGPTQTPTETRTVTPTQPTATRTSTPTVTSTASPTNTRLPTRTPTITRTITPTRTRTNTFTPEPDFDTPTQTVPPTAAVTGTPTPTPSETGSPGPTGTTTSTGTVTPTGQATGTPTRTATASATSAATTVASTATATRTATASATEAPTTPAPTSTASHSPTIVPSLTPTTAPSLTPTPPATATPTLAPTEMQSATPTTTAATPTVTASTPTATADASATPTQTPLKGDLNMDGVVNQADVTLLVGSIFEPNPPPAADVNGDGRVNAADLAAEALAAEAQ